MTGRSWWMGGALLLLVSLGGLSWWSAAAVGDWLVVADPLERADAIVVLNGPVSQRAAEAAAIFLAGWANEVWLTRGSNPVVRAAAVPPRHGRDEEERRAALEALGVAPSAIRVVPSRARNTMEELQVVARELARRGGDRVILVTSKAHSRRARAIWRAVAGMEERAIVRYARSDPFDGRRWWERSEQRGVVWHELLGLVNVWAGFPVRPDWAKAPSSERQIIGRSVAEPVTGYDRGKRPTMLDFDQADHGGEGG